MKYQLFSADKCVVESDRAFADWWHYLDQLLWYCLMEYTN